MQPFWLRNILWPILGMIVIPPAVDSGLMQTFGMSHLAGSLNSLLRGLCPLFLYG